MPPPGAEKTCRLRAQKWYSSRDDAPQSRAPVPGPQSQQPRSVIIYSVTVSVERSSSAEWLDWMTSVHIPDVMNAGYFASYTIRRLVEPAGHPDKDTYVIEYECKSLERYQAYQREAAPALQRDHSERYRGRFVANRRVMETVD